MSHCPSSCGPMFSGPRGLPGSAILTGNGAPTPCLGRNGDFYLDNVSGNYYQKKCSKWGDPVGRLQIFEPLNISAQQDPQLILSPVAASFTSPDVDMTIEPLGNGALRGSSTGNARGINAVDWQINRESDETWEVASGDNSVVAGGFGNAAESCGDVASGGNFNDAFGGVSTISGGIGSGAGGYGSAVFGGLNNYAAEDFSGVGGLFSQASGFASFAYGAGLTVSDDYSAAVGVSNVHGTISGHTRQFMVGGGVHSPVNLMSVDSVGNVYAEATFHTGGADYAEYMESNDTQKYPVGTSVVFTGVNSKIRIAQSTDTPIGVVTQNPSIVGNSAESHWSGKFTQVQETQDVYETVKQDKQVKKPKYTVQGNQVIKTTEMKTIKVPVTQEMDIVENGKVIGKRKVIQKTKTGTRTINTLALSPNFDATKTYVPRSARPEWNLIGLHGVISVLKTSPVAPNWVLMDGSDATYNVYYVK